MKFKTAFILSFGGVYISAILMCISFFNGLDFLGNLFALCILGFFIAFIFVGLTEERYEKTN